MLLISIFGTSTFAASPGIGRAMLVSINEIGQDIRFSLLAGGFGNSFFSRSILGFFSRTPNRTPKRKQQSVERIVILPGDPTVLQGEKINFTALGLGRDDESVGGLQFNWSVTDAGRKLAARPLPNGNFTAYAPGTFIVVAETLGKQVQATITVRENPGYHIRKALERDEKDRPEKEKQFLKKLTDKGALKTREISTKKVYDPKEEKKLDEEEKQFKRDNPPNPNANPNHDDKTKSPAQRGPSADSADGAGETEVEAPEGSVPAAPLMRPPDEGGWNGGNWWTADDPGNQVGNPPGMSPDAVAGNGNFQMSAPVIALPGRGIDINLSLNYNSRLWSKSGGAVSYDSDKGFPAPGWSLGFGKMMRMGSGGGCMMVDADGTRRSFTGSSSAYSYNGYYSNYFSGHTADGSFVDYSCSYTYSSYYGGSISGSARLANGTTVTYASGTASGDQAYPTQITDAQGNYITISYVNNRGPEIQTVTDTLGRVIRFGYDSSNRLVSITAPRLDNTGVRTLARLHYNQLALNYAFAAGITPDTPTDAPYVLDAIYYPGTNTGYWFGDLGGDPSYSSYGMLAKVMEMRGMSWSGSGYHDQGAVTMGTMTKQANYNYPLGPDPSLADAPTYTTLAESWAGMNTAPAVTGYEIYNNATPRSVRVTQPNGVKSIQNSYNAPGQWNDGLIYEDETRDPNNVLLGKSVVVWGQGAYDTARPTHMEMTDERGQTVATDLTYGANYNQLESKKEYDYNGGPLLRETRSSYENNWQYTNRHIFNLVKSNEVYDGAGNRVAKTDYEYDNNSVVNGTGNPNLKATPGVIMHNYQSDPFTTQTQTDYSSCVSYYSYECGWLPDYSYTCSYCNEYGQTSAYDPNTIFRGNVTKTTSYADAANPASGISQTKQYDVTGNLVAESASCCELKTYDFNVGTQYAYPTSATRGAADQSSLIRNTTQATYDYNTGLVKTTTDANGRTDTNNYDAETLRPTIPTTSTGAYSVTGYYDANMEIIHEVHEAGGNLASNTITTLNGLGQATRTATRGANNVWDIVNTEYDNLGRVRRQTKPYRNGEPVYWTEVEYDALGRTTKVIEPDGSVAQAIYNEAAGVNGSSGLPGETIRNVDAWGRERWARHDALGRLAEVVEPNPSGSDSVFSAGSLATRYTYNTLGNLTESNQGGGQMRYFAYDSLGRMTRRKLAEQTATINAAGQYVGEGGSGAVWSGAVTYDNRSNITKRIDARGVVTNYSYQLNGADDPLNRLQSVSYDLSGPHDTSRVIHTGAPPVTYQYMTTGDQDRLWKTSAWNVVSEFAYNDAEGRVSDSTQTMTSRSSYPMTTSYTYDSLNRVTDVRYPAQYGLPGSPRKLVHNAFQIGSGLTALTVDGQVQAGDFIYNAAGQTTQMKVGAAGANQLTEEYSFDPQTGLMTNQKVKNAGGGELLNLSYGYQRRDGNGNLLAGRTSYLAEIVNNLDRNKDRRYEYDALGRLTAAKGGAAALGQGSASWTQNYAYDIFGNRTSVTASGQTGGVQIPTDGIANLSYNTLTNRITTAGYEYDNNGNLTRGLAPDGQSWYRYEYDDANRLVYIKQDNGATLQTQEFGIGNERISLTDAASNQKTYYQGNKIEYTESNNSGVLSWAKSYVYLGDSLLSTTMSNGAGGEAVEYHHPDALGTRLVSNPQTGAVTENVNLPFGTQIANESTNTSNKRKFTSYDRSAITGLDYAQNRTYDSKQGRFTQVDPIGMSAASLMNPQTLNLYNYCGNDPINNTDPQGLFWGTIGKFFKKVWKGIKVAVAIIAAVVAIAIAIYITAGAAGAVFAGSGFAATTAGIGGATGVIGAITAIANAAASVYNAVGAIKDNFAQTKDRKPKKYPCPPNINDIINGRGWFPSNVFQDVIKKVLAHQKANNKEAGGWILLSPDGQKVTFRIKDSSEPKPEWEFDPGYRKWFRGRGDNAIQIMLDRPEDYAGDLLNKGWLVVGDLHSHPDTGNTVDQADLNRSTERQVPGVIIDLNGNAFPYGVLKGILGVGIPKRCKK